MEVIHKTIWSGYKGVFEENFARLNKVLKRMHKPLMTFKYENERVERREFVTHFKGESHLSDEIQIRDVLLCDVTIYGERIIKKDDKPYRYIGSVRFVEGVKRVDPVGDEFLEYFGEKFRENVCDHCGTIRKRNSYSLFEAEGKVYQIGSTCVEKYFGISVDRYLTAVGELFSVLSDDPDFDEYCKSRGGEHGGVSYDEISRIADMVTEGFKVWKKSDEYTAGTTDIVREMLRKCDYSYSEHGRTIDREEVIAYWEKKPVSAFQMNVLSAMENDFAPMRSLGIYLYGIFEAGKDKFSAKIADETGELNEHFGNVGDKIVRELVLEKINSFDGFYGTTYVCRFHDLDGRKFVWFASNCPDIDIGAKVSVKGTVKKHDEYNGQKQTVITRCKVAA